MLLKRVLNYFKGLVCVKLSGGHCELVLNSLHRKNIDFWRLQRLDEQSVSLTVYEKDLLTLKELCTRYFIEMTVEKVHSFSVLKNYYRKRWGVMAGLLIAIALLVSINCFVWDITVSGCDEKTTETEILRQFDQLGFGVGAFRFGWDFSDLENKFMMENKDVIWVSVNMRFTTAYIELQERSGATEKIYDLTTPCDIYAARDGQIVSMMVSSGVPLVQVGDSVRAGEKLVSREYVDKYGETIIVHSIATIKANTTRILSAETPLTQTIHTPTGKYKSFFVLNIFNFQIPLYFKENISYNNYDLTEERHVLKIGKSFALPISVYQKTYTEVTVETKEIPQETAKLTAMSKLEQQEKNQLFEAKILEKKIEEEIVGGQLVLTAEYRCLEDIALTMGD